MFCRVTAAALPNLGVTLVALGSAVLVGWLLDVELLLSIRPGLAPMMPNAAAGFLLLGAAVAARGTLRGAFGRWIPHALGASVALLGALTLLEYRLGWDGGFDTLLIESPEAPAEHPHPLRMAEIAAVGFLLSGLGVVLMPVRRAWPVVQGLGLAVATLALTTLIGYAYGVDTLYSTRPFSTIALHASIGFLLASAGLLAATPEHGLARLITRDGAAGSTVRLLLPLAVTVPFVLRWLLLGGADLGLYDVEFGLGLFAVASIVLFVALIWGYAAWLDRAEARRQEVEAQLVHAQRMESIGQLAGGIAHDFNNVLTVILGTATALQRTLPHEEAQRDLLMIQEASERAATLTRQLLAFGRRQILSPQVLNLNDVVRRSERILRRLVRADVTIVTRLDPALDPVYVDPSQIEFVLVNLAMNAREAMPAGGTLTIETKNTSLAAESGDEPVAAGPYAALVVSDTGIGMTRPMTRKIFEPFFTTKELGSGLGLSTVHGIVRQSDGHVRVYSEPGVGTTFKVYFPQVDALAEPLPPSRPGLATRLGSERILVVDDDSATRDVVAEILERSGYSVLRACDGREALSLAEAEEGPIDLAVTDVVMPGMAAKDLHAALLRRRPDMRFLYMSGYAGEMIAQEGLVEGGLDLIEKPFTPRDLVNRVRSVLDRPD